MHDRQLLHLFRVCKGSVYVRVCACTQFVLDGYVDVCECSFVICMCVLRVWEEGMFDKVFT